MPQMPSTTVPFAVSEFFPSPSETGLTDDRQHAVALSYIIPVRGECEPRQDALQLSWMTPDEALSLDVQDEFEGGREASSARPSPTPAGAAEAFSVFVPRRDPGHHSSGLPDERQGLRVRDALLA